MDTHYGPYGGQYIAETLMPALLERETEYLQARSDPVFQAELHQLLRDYVGRESPLYLARRLTVHCGGAQIYLKREDLNHTGAHKINNTLGQALLARRMGKRRIIAETGAGMHGVAGAQCRTHEDVGGEGPRRHRRSRDPEGRHERGHSGMDRVFGGYLLHDRHLRRAASLPDAGQGVPVGDRPGGAPAMPDPGGKTAA